MDGDVKAVRRGRCRSPEGPRIELTDREVASVFSRAALGPASNIALRISADTAPGHAEATERIAAATGRAVTTERLAAVPSSCAPEPDATIRSSIVPHLATVERCYDAVLRGDGGLRGEIEVHFRIDPEGNVAWEKIGAASLESPALHRCLLDVVRDIVFAPHPPARPLLYVKYPFRFGMD